MGIVKQWRAEAKTNRFWPLPSDYNKIGNDGRKAARVALVSNHSTPAHMALAWDAFCQLYLRPESSRFYKRYKPPAPMHYCAIYDSARYASNAVAYPRGAGKSTTLLEALPIFLACTRPGMEVWAITSKIELIRRRFDIIKMQLSSNELILNDFGLLRETKGEGKWASEHLRLTNRFRLIGGAIGGKNLGGRPDLLLLDDVEHDPKSPEAGAKLTEQLRTDLERIYLPMMEEGTALMWIGTIRRRSTLLHRIQHSRDPQFDDWNRRVVSIYNPRTTDFRPCWNEKWNAARVIKIKKKLRGAFGSEMMNIDSSEGASSFKWDARFQTYSVQQPDALWFDDPLRSSALLVRALRPTTPGAQPQLLVHQAKEILPDMFRFICADYAKTVGYTSDFQCCMTMALDSDLSLWLLDLWLMRKEREVLIDAMIQMALKWEVRGIYPESVAVQQHTTDMLFHAIEKPFLEKLGYVPDCKPLKGKEYQKDKSERIKTISWRFDRDRIFLPANELNTYPWNELVLQISQFSGVAENLRHDDAIDTLSMSTQVIRKRRVPTTPIQAQLNQVEKVLAEEAYRRLGISPMSGFDPTQLTPEQIDTFREHAEAGMPRGSRVCRVQYMEDAGSEKELRKTLENSVRRVGSLFLPKI